MLIVIAVCSVIALAAIAALARIATEERHADRLRFWNLQAEWLAEAALEKAAASLAENTEYAGETWNLSHEEMAGRYGAAVKIDVEPVANLSTQRIVRVQVDFPNDPHDRRRMTKEVVVEQNRKNLAGGDS